MTPNDRSRARFGLYEVDLHTHELWKFGTRLKLVGQPFEILAVLLSKPGKLVTREELRSRLWPADTFVDFNHGLNAAVNKLREALCDSAEKPRYIETLPRRGYRFIAAVEPAGSEKVCSAETHGDVVEVEEPPARTRPINCESAEEIVPFANYKDSGAGETAAFRKLRVTFPMVTATVLVLGLAFGSLIWFFLTHQSTPRTD